MRLMQSNIVILIAIISRFGVVLCYTGKSCAGWVHDSQLCGRWMHCNQDKICECNPGYEVNRQVFGTCTRITEYCDVNDNSCNIISERCNYIINRCECKENYENKAQWLAGGIVCMTISSSITLPSVLVCVGIVVFILVCVIVLRTIKMNLCLLPSQNNQPASFTASTVAFQIQQPTVGVDCTQQNSQSSEAYVPIPTSDIGRHSPSVPYQQTFDNSEARQGFEQPPPAYETLFTTYSAK